MHQALDFFRQVGGHMKIWPNFFAEFFSFVPLQTAEDLRLPPGGVTALYCASRHRAFAALVSSLRVSIADAGAAAQRWRPSHAMTLDGFGRAA